MTAKPRRALGLFDVVCVGVNAIIGSGIFFFPGKLAALLGPSSILSFLIIGLLLIFVSLCFSEAASYFEKSGGAYVYAEAAFGGKVGFSVGWLSWVNQIFAWAAVATAVSTYLAYFWEGFSAPFSTRLVAVTIIAAMGVLNFIGVKLGAQTSNLFTIGKLIPLIIILVLGLPALQFSNFVPFAPHGFSSFGAASLMTFFAFQGFENISAPAGEIARARRNVPLAVSISLLLTLFIYSLIQTVAVGVHPGVAGSDRPLAEVAEILLGPIGGVIVAVGAVISMVGFNSSTALTSPRYLVALAGDGHIPGPLKDVHPKFGTPYLAVAFTTLVSVCLALVLDFKSLVDITNVAVSIQYSVTCLSLLKLRKERGIAKSPIIPILGAVISLWLGWQAALNEMLWCFAFLLSGFAIKALNSAWQRGQARAS